MNQSAPQPPPTPELGPALRGEIQATLLGVTLDFELTRVENDREEPAGFLNLALDLPVSDQEPAFLLDSADEPDGVRAWAKSWESLGPKELGELAQFLEFMNLQQEFIQATQSLGEALKGTTIHTLE